MKNQDPSICFLQETHFTAKYTKTESEGTEKDISCKWKQQESGASNTHIRQTDIKTKAIKKEKERYCIMIKWSVQEEIITLINIYTPYPGAPYIHIANTNRHKRRNWQ